jgi:hypothetical protein
MRTLALVFALVPTLTLAQQPAPPAPAPAAPASKPAPQNQVYKWVDEQGVVHYTDKPPSDGAQPAKLPPLQTYKGGTKPALGKFEKSNAKTGGAAGAQLDIVTPAHDETFRGTTVPVAVQVTPQLKDGQKLIYLLDGTPASPPTGDTAFALTNVERGTHTVTVTVVDEAGTQHGSSSGVTFHVLLPGVDSKPKKPGAKPSPKPRS